MRNKPHLGIVSASGGEHRRRRDEGLSQRQSIARPKFSYVAYEGRSVCDRLIHVCIVSRAKSRQHRSVSLLWVRAGAGGAVRGGNARVSIVNAARVAAIIAVARNIGWAFMTFSSGHLLTSRGIFTFHLRGKRRSSCFPGSSEKPDSPDPIRNTSAQSPASCSSFCNC